MVAGTAARIEYRKMDAELRVRDSQGLQNCWRQGRHLNVMKVLSSLDSRARGDKYRLHLG